MIMSNLSNILRIQVFWKGKMVKLGLIEMEVLRHCPAAAVANNWLPSWEIAKKAGLSCRQALAALNRLGAKGFVDCIRPFDDGLLIWGKTEDGEEFCDATSQIPVTDRLKWFLGRARRRRD